MKIIEFEPTNEDIKRYIHFKDEKLCFKSDDGIFEMILNEFDKFLHLKIHRIDDKPIRNCNILQEIKNVVMGEDVVAVEIYPKKLDYKDGSNTYHLWSWENMEYPNLANMPRYS